MSDPDIEYLYDPEPDAVERLKQAWDLIVKLIVEDFEQEQDE